MNTKRGNTTHLETLKLYQRWRTGEDGRPFDEIGINGADIGEALNWAIALAAENKALLVALRVERDEALARAELLEDTMMDVSSAKTTKEACTIASDVIDELPAISLARVKAQAVTDAMEYAIDQVGSDASADDCVDAMCEYLEQVSEGKFPTVGSTGNTWRSIKAAEGGVPDGMIEFAQRCLQDSREGRDCDRTDIYAWALECGLIEHYLATEPCDRGPECDCAAISGFPSWCQRDSALLATQQPKDQPMNQREAFEQGHIETDAIYWNGLEYKPSNEGKYAAAVAETANNLYAEFKRGAAWQAATEQGVGEPVAEVTGRDGFPGTFIGYELNGYGASIGDKLYTHPPKPTGGGVPNQLIEAIKPFVDAFEYQRPAHTRDDNPGVQEMLDRNQITPSGTTIGDWRRLADAYAALLATQQPPKAITKEESDLLVWARWAASIGINDKGIKSSWQFEQLQNAIQSMTATQQPPERG